MDIDLKEIAVYIVLIILVLIAAQHLNVVVSGSMEPVMYRGDIVVLEKANLLGLQEFNPADVEVGDIVVYNAAWHDGSQITSRVITFNGQPVIIPKIGYISIWIRGL